MLVIGSQAMAHGLRQAGVIPPRPPADIDVICSESEMFAFCHRQGLMPVRLADYKWHAPHPEYNGIEFEVLEQSYSGRLYELHWESSARQYVSLLGELLPVAPLEVCYSIKRSHRYYPRMWDKHINDYHLLR